MQSREDGKSVSGRCYCGLSAGAYCNKVKGQSEVERSTLTRWKPTQREIQISGGGGGGGGGLGGCQWEISALGKA